MATRPGPAAIALALLCPLAAPARAQGIPITVSAFTTEKTCTTYELEWGRELTVANRYMAATARSWGTDLVRECRQNFPGLRTTLAAAFASAGVPPELRARRLRLTGRLTDVGYENGNVATAGSSIGGQSMLVSVDFEVRDAAGRVVYGGSLTKHFPLSANVQTSEVSYTSEQSGRTTFSQLQREVAYAVARAVTFHVVPLRVVANDGLRLKLNYGAPFVPLGGAILVPHAGSLSTSRLNVTSAASSGAIAQSEGDVGTADVPVGTIVTFVEADDPSANSQVFERVALPEH